ncbi:MAG: hypothetical protein O2887_10595 [Bacteroidetes bacterium]|nr:hypothetical protein [Bacteroidota bacterium]
MKQIFIILSLVLLFTITSCDKRPSNQPAASSESMSGLHPYVTAGDPNIGRAFRIASGDLVSNILPLTALPFLQSKKQWDTLSARLAEIAGTREIIPERVDLLGGGIDYPGTIFPFDVAMYAWDGAGFLQSDAATSSLLYTLKMEKDGNIQCYNLQNLTGMSWTVAAWANYLYTGSRPFLKIALAATLGGLEYGERTEFDSELNLFRGLAFMGDGISQYPDFWAKSMPGSGHIMNWTQHNPDKKVAVGLGLPMHVLSIQCLNYQGYVLAARMQQELGLPVDKTLLEKAARLKAAINKHFWREDAGIYRYMVGPFCVSDQQEGWGNTLAILFNIASPEQAKRIFANIRITPQGIPVIWPNWPRYTSSDTMTFGQRNNIWPSVNGVWSEVAASAGHADLFTLELKKTADRACRDNQFAEMYHPITGEIYGGVQEGMTKRSGVHMKAFIAARLGGTGEPTPEAIAKLFPPMKGKEGINLWQSCGRNTMSSTAYLRMVLHGLCGIKLETDGITFHPTIPEGMSPVAVYELPYRQAELEIHINGEGQKVRKITINGQGAAKIPTTAKGKQVVEIEMGS